MTPTAPTRRAFAAAAGLSLAPGFAVRALAAGGGLPRAAVVTNHGVIVVEADVRRAPISATNWLRYVDAGAYDGGLFFRAARTPGRPTEGDIVAGPNPRFHPFPPIAHESTAKTGLRHVRGAVSLGRFEPGTARANFFICASDLPYLDAHPGAPGDNLGFAVFGRVVSGMAVVDKILSLPANGKTKFKEQRGQWLSPPVPILRARRVRV